RHRALSQRGRGTRPVTVAAAAQSQTPRFQIAVNRCGAPHAPSSSQFILRVDGVPSFLFVACCFRFVECSFFVTAADHHSPAWTVNLAGAPALMAARDEKPCPRLPPPDQVSGVVQPGDSPRLLNPCGRTGSLRRSGFTGWQWRQAETKGRKTMSTK